MYPIEHDDCISAYISATTEEVKESGFATSTHPEPCGSFDRFASVVGERLRRRRTGATSPTRPLPSL
jgi:hypothetical protein